MSFDLGAHAQQLVAFGPRPDAGTRTGFALDTAYTYNSAGKAIGWRFVAPATTTLTDIYIFNDLITGSPGNLTWEVRDYGASVSRPGTTVLDSGTVSPGASNDKWLHITPGSPPSLTAGTVYWVVVGDAAGSGVNNTTILSRGSGPTARAGADVLFLAHTTADGFATNGTGVNTPAVCVLKFGDGRLVGQALTTTSNYASNTRERGNRILSLDAPIVVVGVQWGTGTNQISGLKVYDGATAPGGTPVYSRTFGNANNLAAVLFAPFTLAAGATWDVVLTFSSAHTGPAYFSIEDGGSFADLKASLCGGGKYYGIIDDGAGAWAVDDATISRASFFLGDFPAATAGGAYIIG